MNDFAKRVYDVRIVRPNLPAPSLMALSYYDIILTFRLSSEDTGILRNMLPGNKRLMILSYTQGDVAVGIDVMRVS
jgi:hypothetical protein